MKADLRALLCELIKSDCALNNLLSRCRWGTQCSALSRPVKSMWWQFIVRYPHQKHTQEEKNIIWYPIPNVAYETLPASGRSFHWGTVCFCWGPLLWRRYGTKLSNKSIDSIYTIFFFWSSRWTQPLVQGSERSYSKTEAQAKGGRCPCC